MEQAVNTKIIRLISLNAWCGRSLYPLMRFFRNRKEGTDIFCLQEVRSCDQAVADSRHPNEYTHGRLYEKIARVLEGFEGSFASFEDDHDRMSISLFWRNDLPVKDTGDIIIYSPENPVETEKYVISPRKLQYIVIDAGENDVVIAHFHGLWNGGSKTDTPERIIQSKHIAHFLSQFDCPKILCGDFNLLPNMTSLAILENGMRNLIGEYGIESTRTALYRHYNDPNESKFADYMLISSDIWVKKFAVLPDIVSDHTPLYLEFEI